MAKINWDTAQAELENQENGGSGVGFFTLKNDNDFAIVRIMHDSVDDFDICAVHSIGEGKSFRNISCLRDPSEPIEKCPLCAAGKKVALRMYIHLIEYTKDEKSGKIKAQAKVWDRHTSYAKTLIQYMKDYGPLSDIIFKIVRHGKAGSTDTTYDIIYANPKVYAPEFYPKDLSLFDGYTVEGTAVAKKTYEELIAIANGAPVETTTNAPAQQVPSYAAPTYNNVAPATPAYAPQPVQEAAPTRMYESAAPAATAYGNPHMSPTYAAPSNPAPAATEAAPTGRPRRFY